MSSKVSEWKRVDFSKDKLEFAGALNADLESDGSSLIAITFRLKCGRTVRLRRCDYTVIVEEPVVPTRTVYLAKTTTGLKTQFNSEEEALRAINGIEDAQIVQEIIPVEQEQLQ